MGGWAGGGPVCNSSCWWFGAEKLDLGCASHYFGWPSCFGDGWVMGVGQKLVIEMLVRHWDIHEGHHSMHYMSCVVVGVNHGN